MHTMCFSTVSMGLLAALEDSEGTVSLGVCVFLIGNRLVDHALIIVLRMQ